MEQGLSHDEFTHIRIIVGMVTGLSMARLLAGLSRFVQDPARERIYPVHLAWAVFLLLSVLHFWWFEFGLFSLPRWSFAAYGLVILYAALFFFTCTVLFPDHMPEDGDYAGYFHARRGWFFGLVAALVLIDLADTALKGAAHFEALGPWYPLRQGLLLALALAAIFVRSRRFHAVFAAAAVAGEIAFITAQFDRVA